MMPTLEGLDVAGKRVFLRADLNVPLSPDGSVADETRLRAILPTLKHLLRNNAAVILASHLGRPEGQFNPHMSLAPVGETLIAHLDSLVTHFKLSDMPVGASARKLIRDMKAGEVVLLENLRFDPREEQNNDEFAQKLAEGIDVYVNDAMASAHRTHASLVAIAQHIPVKAAGFLLEKERVAFDTLRNAGHKQRPYMVLLGGRKLADKVPALESLLGHAQVLLVGGEVSHAFLQAMGLSAEIFSAPQDEVQMARTLLRRAKHVGVDVALPVDFAGISQQEMMLPSADVSHMPAGFRLMDIGPKTLALFQDKLRLAKTVFWHGPLGSWDQPAFAQGTAQVGQVVAASGAYAVVHGTDTVAALQRAHLADAFSHVSMAGSAAWSLLQGKPLPALTALEEA